MAVLVKVGNNLTKCLNFYVKNQIRERCLVYGAEKQSKRNEAFLRTTGITQSKCNQGFNLTYYYDELFVSDFREFPLKI